eukprot:SAG31_NODE_654_length_13128_cov_10.472408_6_plen_163_part_00
MPRKNVLQLFFVCAVRYIPHVQPTRICPTILAGFGVCPAHIDYLAVEMVLRHCQGTLDRLRRGVGDECDALQFCAGKQYNWTSSAGHRKPIQSRRESQTGVQQVAMRTTEPSLRSVSGDTWTHLLLFRVQICRNVNVRDLAELSEVIREHIVLRKERQSVDK